jgi:hypothetical protein
MATLAISQQTLRLLRARIASSLSPTPNSGPITPITPPNAGYVDWGFNGTSLDGVSEFFSVRWTGELQIDQTVIYSFRTLSDDGIIAYLDNASIISNPSIHPPLRQWSIAFINSRLPPVSIAIW